MGELSPHEAALVAIESSIEAKRHREIIEGLIRLAEQQTRSERMQRAICNRFGIEAPE